MHNASLHQVAMHPLFPIACMKRCSAQKIQNQSQTLMHLFQCLNIDWNSLIIIDQADEQSRKLSSTEVELKEGQRIERVEESTSRVG